MSGITVTTHRGPRETERALIGWIDRARSSSDLGLRRVLVVVPSQSLRTHLLRRLAFELNGAVLGVEVRSLWGLAATILARAGRPMPRGSELYGILARRAAARQQVLVDALDAFDDGGGLAVAPLKDLASAGLDRSNLEKSLAFLKPLADRDDGRRAIALARASVEAARDMEKHGAGNAANLFEAACREFDEHGDAILHADTIAIHGFVGATGRGRMLLTRLTEARAAHVFLDAGAARPGAPEGALPSIVTEFAERLGVAAPAVEESPERAEVRLFRAGGTLAEVTEVAWRIREAVAAGVQFEDIGVVMRSLEPYALVLRQTFRELGIPFSGGEASPGADPRARSGRAMAELLDMRDEMAADHWMDAWGEGRLEGREIDALQRADILLALRALGAARLRDVASLDVANALRGQDRYPLPVRRGAMTLEVENEDSSPVAGDVVVTRRKITRSWLEVVVELAGRTIRALDEWPTHVLLEAHLEALARLADDLGWSSARTPWKGAVDALREAPLPTIELTRSEFLVLLRPFLSDAASARLGGVGGGVQVMPLARARGLTFDHVFVLGLNRGVLPGAGTEDTLLGDEVRRALRGALPDLGVAATRIDEERHVFDQVLNCSPRVDISWQRSDDEGRELSPSPFIEALKMERPDLVTTTIAALDEERLELPEHATTPRPLPARLALRRAALRRDRDAWLAIAADDGDRARAVAAVEVLAQVDPDRSTKEGRAAWRTASPWYGFVGPIAKVADARARSLFITTLEGLARCPWRTLLGNVLKLEPTPDPLDALPDIDNLLLGSTVHGALENLVIAAGARAAESLVEACAFEPVRVERPDEDAVSAATHRAAADEAFSSGIVQVGFARALARRALPMVRTAIALDWGEGAVAVVGAELEGAVTIGDRVIGFRADRVDRDEDGRLVFSDYKSGKAVTSTTTEAKQREHLLTAVRSGVKLQSAAYALSGAEATGRYLALKPDIDPRTRISTCSSDDREIAAAFQETARKLLRAWDEGVFFPRVEDGKEKEPVACGTWCELTAACIRGDSSHRRRLRELADAVHEEGSPDELLGELWRPDVTGDAP